MPAREPVLVLPLGRIDYDEAWGLQKRLQGRLVAAKRAGERPPHVLLLVEHPPVYTLGQNGDTAHLLRSEADLAAAGATFRKIDRGGDVTFHGPGQLVGYPLLDLERFRPDLHVYLRTLEAVVISTLAGEGVTAGRVEGRTGVWVGPDARGDERKVCAFGIRCTRWVTMHGWALNLNTDLRWFDAIVPCGISDRGVTSLAAELGRPVDEAAVTDRLLGHFAEAFGADLVRVPSGEARAAAEAFAEGEAVG